jgi:alpha-D-ribose 1-methylphosphonate 5-triphosphate synthase subunit PhnI
MDCLKRLLDQEDFLSNYRTVNSERQEEWNTAFARVKQTLEREALVYMDEERTKSTQIAELSRIKMLG